MESTYLKPRLKKTNDKNGNFNSTKKNSYLLDSMEELSENWTAKMLSKRTHNPQHQKSGIFPSNSSFNFLAFFFL